jgi:hypothetical protein
VPPLPHLFNDCNVAVFNRQRTKNYDNLIV